MSAEPPGAGHATGASGERVVGVIVNLVRRPRPEVTMAHNLAMHPNQGRLAWQAQGGGTAGADGGAGRDHRLRAPADA
jgi:hypothetical protein